MSKETITYKGKEYPIRVISMKDNGAIFTRTIADQMLYDAISIDGKHQEWDTPEFNIDQQIYFYVEKGQLELSGKEICEDLLDEPFEFVCDGEYEEE